MNHSVSFYLFIFTCWAFCLCFGCAGSSLRYTGFPSCGTSPVSFKNFLSYSISQAQLLLLATKSPKWQSSSALPQPSFPEVPATRAAHTCSLSAVASVTGSGALYACLKEFLHCEVDTILIFSERGKKSELSRHSRTCPRSYKRVIQCCSNR